LATVLARHRWDEFPHLAAFFDGSSAQCRKAAVLPNMTCLLDAFEDLYIVIFVWPPSWLLPLLATLSPQQIRALERKFAKDAKAEAKRSRSPLERRLRKRAKHWSEFAT